MKKVIAVLLLFLFAFTACSGVDTLTINDAKKILSAHLADNHGFVEGSDYLDDGDEISIFDTDCFVFDWRSGQEGIKDRLIQSFAISIDGDKFFYYDAGKDAWFEDN